MFAWTSLPPPERGEDPGCGGNSMGFEHQEPSTNLGFCRPLPQPQQIGVRLKPEEKTAEAPGPNRQREQPVAKPQTVPV
jgi:hypothetical protein